jgi:hypothetical protein
MLDFFLVSIKDAGWIALLLIVFFFAASFTYQSTFLGCTPEVIQFLLQNDNLSVTGADGDPMGI